MPNRLKHIEKFNVGRRWMILLFVCLRVNDVICDAVWYVNCECDE